MENLDHFLINYPNVLLDLDSIPIEVGGQDTHRDAHPRQADLRDSEKNRIPCHRHHCPCRSPSVFSPDDLDDRDCRICDKSTIDLVLLCGHGYCFSCFNKYYHEFIYLLSFGCQEVARELLLSQKFVPPCPVCQRKVYGRLHHPDDYGYELSGYFHLTCPNFDHVECCFEYYVVEGVKIAL